MYSRTLLRALSLAAALPLAAAVTHAQPTPLTNGQWTYFNSTVFYPGPFTYTSATPFWVTVVDTGVPGDYYLLYDGGTLVGTTTQVIPDDTLFCFFADACLADSRWSRGTFQVAAGSHYFDVFSIAGGQIDPDAAIGVNVSRIPAGTPGPGALPSSVPEPASVALFGGGLALLGLAARRRRLTAA